MRKDDRTFHHNLAIHEAHTHLPQLLTIAKREHPSVPLDDLGIRIDYTVVPPTLSTFLKDHDISPETWPSDSRTQEARSESIIEKAIDRRGRSALIESFVSHGRISTMVMTLAAHLIRDESAWRGRAGFAGMEGDDAVLDEDMNWGFSFMDTLETFLRLKALSKSVSEKKQIERFSS